MGYTDDKGCKERHEGPQHRRTVCQVSWRSGRAKEPALSLKVGGSAACLTPSEPEVKRLAHGPSRLDHFRPRPSWRAAPLGFL